MTNGYYWYVSGAGDQGDLADDTPGIVEIFTWIDQQKIVVCGGDLMYSLEEAHGRFIGPLVPPDVDNLQL